MTQRKIVQIAIDQEYDSPGLYALDDAGRVHFGWWKDGEFAWRKVLPDLPEPSKEPTR